jgi:hypothetical protein
MQRGDEAEAVRVADAVEPALEGGKLREQAPGGRLGSASSQAGLLSMPVSQGCSAATRPVSSGSRTRWNQRWKAKSFGKSRRAAASAPARSPARSKSRRTQLAATGGWVMPEVAGVRPVRHTSGPGK